MVTAVPGTEPPLRTASHEGLAQGPPHLGGGLGEESLTHLCRGLPQPLHEANAWPGGRGEVVARGQQGSHEGRLMGIGI